MELVSTFTLTHGGRNARERQSFQPHETSPAHSVGANLVQSAKANMVNSASHSAQQNSAASRSAKAAKSNAQSKQNSRPRAAKSQSAPPELVAAVAAGPSGGDDSFVEF
jgi:hypothetical protein